MVEVEFGPGKSSHIWMVTSKSDFTREEGTRFVAFEENEESWFVPIMDHTVALDRGGVSGDINRDLGGGRITHAESCHGIEVQYRI